MKLENFQRYQWWLLATYFSPPDDDGVVKNYKLQAQHILPFLTPGNALSQSIDRTGGYGKVIMVNIPSDHHNFSDKRLCERGFAVKQQVHDENRDAYKREIAYKPRETRTDSNRAACVQVLVKRKPIWELVSRFFNQIIDMERVVWERD